MNNKLHFSAYPIVLFMLVAVGRMPELFKPLEPLHLGKIALLLGLIGVFTDGRSRENYIFSNRIVKKVFYIVIFALLSILYSTWKSHSLSFLINVYLAVLIYFYVLSKSTVNTKTLVFYVKGLILTAFMLSMVAVANKTSGRVEISESYDTNDLALVMVTLIPIVYASTFIVTKKTKIFYYLIIILSLYTVMLTASRGGFLGLLMIAIFILYNRKYISNKEYSFSGTLKVLLVMSLIVAVSINFAPEDFKERTLSLLHIKTDYNFTSNKGRIDIWERGLEGMMKRPYGWGLDAFEAMEGELGGRYKAAHNSFIQIGAELGVIALLIYISIFLFLLPKLANIYKDRDRNDEVKYIAFGLRGALYGFLMTSFFLSQAYSAILYSVLGISTAIISTKIATKGENNCES